MINEKFLSSGSYRSSKSKNSIKSKSSKKVKTTKVIKNPTPKIFEGINTKTGLELTKFNNKKEQFYCSFCGNTIMKTGINFSCKHILCANCVSRQILKIGIDKIQDKITQITQNGV